MLDLTKLSVAIQNAQAAAQAEVTSHSVANANASKAAVDNAWVEFLKVQALNNAAGATPIVGGPLTL